MSIVFLLVAGVIVAFVGREIEQAVRTGGVLHREQRKTLGRRVLDAVPPFIYFLLGAGASVFSAEIRAALGLAS